MFQELFQHFMLLLLHVLMFSAKIVLLKKIADCQIGYSGRECELPCRYPNYGMSCQSECLCVEQLCDHVNGCKKCPHGFQGEACQQNCSYPSYGENCQSECECREEQCDFVNGCEGEGNKMYNEGREDNCTSTGRYRNSKALLSSNIFLSFIALIQFIFYLYFSIFYKPRLLYITRF